MIFAHYSPLPPRYNMTGTKKRGLSAGDRKDRMAAAKETALAGLKKVPHCAPPAPRPPPHALLKKSGGNHPRGILRQH